MYIVHVRYNHNHYLLQSISHQLDGLHVHLHVHAHLIQKQHKHQRIPNVKTIFTCMYMYKIDAVHNEMPEHIGQTYA